LVCDLLDYRPDASPHSKQTGVNNNNSNTNTSYDSFFLQYLFSLLMFKESRLQVCQLIESVLLYTPILNLNSISNMRHLLEYIDDDGLACICKIFAVTLSNLDSNEKKYLVSNQRRNASTSTEAPASASLSQPENISSTSTPVSNQNDDSTALVTSEVNKLPNNTQASASSIRDQNQEFLLSLPAFLARLVNLVRRKEYTSRFNGLNCELEHWIRSIDEALSDAEDTESSLLNFNIESALNRNAPPPPPAPAVTSNNNNNRVGNQPAASGNLASALNNSRNFIENNLNQPALLASSKLNNFVYVLYTISLLLIGKEKKKVQKSLTKLRFAHVLNSLFDHLIWNCNCEVPANGNNAALQQRTHTCPEVAVKIQFLRLVHSFCDHSE
jgi:Trpc4-associated protein